MGILCFCVKLMKNEAVVVELWVNSWFFVVDVVLEHVVDELIQWVSLIKDRLLVKLIAIDLGNTQDTLVR